MNNKVAFFDMDGTISAPVYLDDGKLVIGFDANGWIRQCNKEKKKTYRLCKIVQPVIDFAKKLKSEGYTLYILTVALCESEKDAKWQFIEDNNLYDIFDTCIFASQDDEKLTIMANYAKKNDIPISDCMLVEDTYLTLLKAHCAGFQAVHIANILTDTITG